MVAAAAMVVTKRARDARLSERVQHHVFHVAVRSVADAVILIDPRGRITAMNAAAELLTAWTEIDALGKPLGVVFRLVDAETRAAVVNPAMRALYARRIVGPSHDTVLIGDDGREHAVSERATPVCDDYGQPLGCVLVFRSTATRGPFRAQQTIR